MRRSFIILMSLVILSLPVPAAFAASQVEMWPESNPQPLSKSQIQPPALSSTPKAQKQLTVDPDKALPSARSKEEQGGLPTEFADMRRKMKDEFNAWFQDNKQILKECQEAHTIGARAVCEKKKKLSQTRLDIIHAKTRDMLRKIDTWRRKEAGLPPPDWWQNAPRGVTSSSPGSSSDVKRDLPALLPDSSQPVPANTY